MPAALVYTSLNESDFTVYLGRRHQPVGPILQFFNLRPQFRVQLIQLLPFFQQNHKRQELHRYQAVGVADGNTVLQGGFKEPVQDELVGTPERAVERL
jgi:hypothetical protein